MLWLNDDDDGDNNNYYSLSFPNNDQLECLKIRNQKPNLKAEKKTQTQQIDYLKKNKNNRKAKAKKKVQQIKK